MQQNNILPHGFDHCTWEEADHILIGEKWIGIELQKHNGVVDSFKIFFEPGESEIGIFQAEHSLGMLPIKKNKFFSVEKLEEDIIKVDFEYIRDRTASDVRQVAGFLLECAKDIELGDLSVFETLIDDQWNDWGMRLHLRYFCLQEQKGETLSKTDILSEDNEDATSSTV